MEQVPAGSGRPFDLPDRAVLERCIGTPITALREAPGPRSTSYAVRRLVIDLADGRTLDVFHKDFDVSPHPPAVALARGRRECFVYENVLAGRGLGTPELYGVVWDGNVWNQRIVRISPSSIPIWGCQPNTVLENAL